MGFGSDDRRFMIMYQLLFTMARMLVSMYILDIQKFVISKLCTVTSFQTRKHTHIMLDSHIFTKHL